MFSFVRTVVDFIQSASGLKVKPPSLGGVGSYSDEASALSCSSPRRCMLLVDVHHLKAVSPVDHVCHTALGSILESYKQALATAHLLNSAQLSTALIESDFAFAISKYCAQYENAICFY